MSDTKQKLISIRSQDRKSGSIDNFECEINTLSNIHWFKIQDLTIMLSHYQIDSTNKRITFEEGAGNLFADLKEGNYTTSQIETEIKTKLDTSGALTYTVSIDNINNKITISATGAFGLKWTLNESLAKTLGFSVSDLTGVATYTAPGVINLNRIFSSFNVYSNQLSKYHSSVVDSNLKSQLLFRAINAISPPSSHFHYTNDQIGEYLMKYSPNERVKYIDLRITDLDNKAINFQGVDEIILNIIAYIR